MKSISKYISSALMIAVAGCAFTSCDDWTEPEHVDLGYGTIDTADPAAYEKYLANLREYRKTDHTLVYTWFDNLETAFGSQGHRISAIPDSVDIIVLQNPEKVTDQMIQEMYEARVNKGQQFSYCINLDDIMADYTAICEERAALRIDYANENGEDAPIPAELQDPDIVTFITETTAQALTHFNNIGFDCIMAGFAGKSTMHMTAEELAAYKAQTNTFLGIINDWHQRNSDVSIDLFGKPQNVKSDLLKDIRIAFLSDGLNATSADTYSIYVAEVDNALPVDKLGMVATIPSEDGKTGYFSNGQLAVAGLGTWAAASGVGAVGVYNTGRDYFLTTGTYENVRNLIQTVNPSAK